MENKILLVDTSTLMHSAKYGLGKKITPLKIKNGLCYGFLLKLQFVIAKVHPDLIVFAFDSKKSKRIKIYPEYKAKRHKNKTDAEKEIDVASREQFDIITKQIIPKLGYRNNFKVRGLEADDIIASICKKYKNDRIVISSNDGDLYQLLTPKVSMFRLNNNSFFTHKNFQKKYRIKPKDWKYIKAIAGCTSDNVRGISGVKETRAIQYFKGELPTHYKTFKMITCKEGKKIIKRNKKLVWLPFKGTPKFTIKPNRITVRNIKKVAKEFNFKSMESYAKEWYYKLKDNQ